MTQRTPLAFVDNDGYVTPFNGRIVDNLPGKYLYTQREVDFYLSEQRRMEAEREATRFGETPSKVDNAPTNGVNFEPPAPPMAPVPPVPPQHVAQPASDVVPPTLENLTPEQLALLQPGVNGNTAYAQVMTTK